MISMKGKSSLAVTWVAALLVIIVLLAVPFSFAAKQSADIKADVSGISAAKDINKQALVAGKALNASSKTLDVSSALTAVNNTFLLSSKPPKSPLSSEPLPSPESSWGSCTGPNILPMDDMSYCKNIYKTGGVSDVDWYGLFVQQPGTATVTLYPQSRSMRALGYVNSGCTGSPYFVDIWSAATTSRSYHFSTVKTYPMAVWLDQAYTGYHSYCIKASFTPDYNPLTECQNSATISGDDTYTSGTLQYPGVAKWYKVYMANAGNLRVTLDAQGTDMEVYVYSACNSDWDTYYVMDTVTDGVDYVEKSVPAGYYYIAVWTHAAAPASFKVKAKIPICTPDSYRCQAAHAWEKCNSDGSAWVFNFDCDLNDTYVPTDPFCSMSGTPEIISNPGTDLTHKSQFKDYYCSGTSGVCNYQWGGWNYSQTSCPSDYCNFGSCSDCTAQDQCWSEYYCNIPVGTCIAKKPNGQDCLQNYECAGGYCVSGTCTYQDYICGNSIIESSEECDGSNLGNATCQSLGYSAGTLSCQACNLQTSGCYNIACSSDAGCNDNITCTTDFCNNPGTQSSSCSHSAITSCVSGDGCCAAGCNANTDTDCSPVCGNSVIEGVEQCDGNNQTQQCGTSDVGVCKFGNQTKTCAGNCSWNAWGACEGAVLPSIETLNGLDDDCDGLTDEGVCGNGVCEASETSVSCPQDCAEPCSVTSAQWQQGIVHNGENAGVALTTTSGCNAQAARIDIYEKDKFTNTPKDIIWLSVNNGNAGGIWSAQWMEDSSPILTLDGLISLEGEPEYGFNVYINNTKLATSSNELKVVKNTKPQTPPTDWYCGDLHAHTKYSTTDFSCWELNNLWGFGTDVLKSQAKELGLSWISFTDHSYCLNDADWAELKQKAVDSTENDFVSLASIEVSANEKSEYCANDSELPLVGCTTHIGSQAITQRIEGELLWEESKQDPQDVINNVNSQNGFSVLNHPKMTLWDFESIDLVNGYTGVEIWNSGEGYNQNAVNAWVNQLNKGKKVFAFAGTDTHDDYSDGVRNCVKMDSLSDQNLVSSLKTGVNYVTDGPTLILTSGTHSMGETVQQNYGDAMSFAVQYDLGGDSGTLKIYENGLHSSYAVSGAGTKTVTYYPKNNAYYRAELETSNGKRAHSNPIWANITYNLEDYADIYKPEIFLSSNEQHGQPTAYFTGPIPDDVANPAQYAIEYWYYWPAYGTAGTEQWQPVILILNLSMEPMTAYTQVNGLWAEQESEFLAFTKNPKVYFAANYHTPSISWENAWLSDLYGTNLNDIFKLGLQDFALTGNGAYQLNTMQCLPGMTQKQNDALSNPFSVTDEAGELKKALVVFEKMFDSAENNIINNLPYNRVNLTESNYIKSGYAFNSTAGITHMVQFNDPQPSQAVTSTEGFTVVYTPVKVVDEIGQPVANASVYMAKTTMENVTGATCEALSVLTELGKKGTLKAGLTYTCLDIGSKGVFALGIAAPITLVGTIPLTGIVCDFGADEVSDYILEQAQETYSISPLNCNSESPLRCITDENGTCWFSSVIEQPEMTELGDTVSDNQAIITMRRQYVLQNTYMAYNGENYTIGEVTTSAELGEHIKYKLPEKMKLPVVPPGRRMVVN